MLGRPSRTVAKRLRRGAGDQAAGSDRQHQARVPVKNMAKPTRMPSTHNGLEAHVPPNHDCYSEADHPVEKKPSATGA